MKLILITAWAALSTAAAQTFSTSIDADPQGNINIVVEDGKEVGYKVGEKVTLFSEFESFPGQWRDYSDATLRAMNYGFSMGSAAAAGQPTGASGSTQASIPGFEGKAWNEIETLAAGGTVSFWMWDGAPHINAWVRDWLAPRVSAKYGIQLVVPPGKGAAGAVTKVAAERAASGGGAQTCSASSPAPCDGSIDLIWINKENFRLMKTANNLFGPWANFVPSSANFDFFSPAIAFDAGTATQGFEMPYNEAQVVFHYDTALVASPPKTIPDFVAWIKANPNSFTYSNVDDFTGFVFVQQLFYHFAGAGLGGGKSWQDFLGPFNEELYNERAPRVWKELRDLEPFLYKEDNTPFSYPSEHTSIRDLFAAGKVSIDLSYDPNHAAGEILNGKYANTTKGYVLEDGTIANTNFVAIPFNSPNKAAAMVVGNYIARLEAIFTRAQPERWGALPAFDANSKRVKDLGWDAAFDYITSHHATPTVEDLTAARLAELGGWYVDVMKKDWKDCVVEKLNEAKCGV